MGRPRKPTDALKLSGAYRKDRHDGHDAAELVAGVPECPDWLAGEARAEWDRQLADLAARRLLSKTCRPALAVDCHAWGEFVDAQRKITALGDNGLVTTTDKGNEVQHPLVSIRNKAGDRIVRLGKEFGFTPASQARVAIAASEPKPLSAKTAKYFLG